MSITHRSRRHGARALLAAVGVAALGCALLARGVPAAAPDAETRAALDRSVRFLQDAQNADGGFGGVAGAPSDPVFSAWAAYALAGAGINPQDQARPGGVDVHTYLTQNTADLFQTTDYDRVALVALASGTSPHDFGGVDAAGTVLSRQLPDGSFPQVEGGTGWINSTIWSIFPLSALDRPDADLAVQRAADWLLTQQRPDGSWPSYSPSSASDADMTGAAIEALNAAGRHDAEAERSAFEYLLSAQSEDGGFAALPGGEPNSASTAWVVQAMWSASVDPRSWRTAAGRDPLSFLASLQRPDGSIGHTATSDANSLWMTAQVGPALAGRAYPLPPVPRQLAAPERPAPQTAAVGEVERDRRRGRGGRELVRGDGVIAGGGGRGAPLFSAPQPQSGGSTPRGARDVRAARSAAVETAAQEAEAARRERQLHPGASTAEHRPRAADGTGGGGSEVEGVLVSGGPSPAAPGLFGASRGGDPDPALAIGLLAALAAAAAIGIGRERRSVA
jgi:Squalene-hopene cyclase C-terminal domain/Prenyltransferase and squalene oxidase repeat